MSGFIKLIIAVIVLAMFSLGFYDQLFNLHKNECEMTYMYEYPTYIPVPLPIPLRKRFPHYKLYVYGEGSYAQQLAKKQYSGIPVLFIPGNGGSYKQVRSLGSVAYRKAMDEDTPRVHFNFFTVDLNEELAAFFGPALHAQSLFVSEVVQHILKLYNDGPRTPTTVVLVGHSMGGLVARAVPVLTNADPSLTPLIITQATPHTRPVIVTDRQIATFYHAVNSRWSARRKKRLKDTTLVSVGAGRNDIQVSNSYVMTSLADVSSTTVDVPSCWLTTDHQAIVWCKQLVMATVRALFECVDTSTYQISEVKERLVNAFNYHLIQKSDGKLMKYAYHPKTLIQLNPESYWTEINKRQYHLAHPKGSKETFLMFFQHIRNSNYARATIMAHDLDAPNWVMMCIAIRIYNKTKICDQGENFSGQTYIVPGKRKILEIDFLPLIDIDYTHMLVWLPYNDDDDEINVYVDIHGKESRKTKYVAPVLTTFMSSEEVVDGTPEKAIVYKLKVTGFFEPWQSYYVYVHPLDDCEAKYSTEILMSPSWDKKRRHLLHGSEHYQFIAELDTTPVNKAKNYSVTMNIVLDPSCRYTVSMQVNIIGVFRRLGQLYAVQIPAYCVAQILAIVAYQYKHFGTEGKCDYLLNALGHISPLAIIPFVKATSFLLKYLEIQDDLSYLEQIGISIGLLPVLLFLVAMPITYCLCIGTWLLVMAWGNGAHVFIKKILKRSIGSQQDLMGELLVTGLSKIPVVLVIALISMAYATCGTLAICVATGVYFIKIFKIYEDYLQTFLLTLIPGVQITEKRQSELSSAQLHIFLMILVGFIAAIGMPSLVIWGKLVKLRTQLYDDPTFTSATLCLLALTVLWQKDIPKHNYKYYQVVGFILNGLAILVVLIGSVNLYRIPYIICVALIVIAVHQLLTPCVSADTQDTDKAAALKRVDTEDSMSSNNTGVGIAEITNNDPLEQRLSFDGSDTDASDSLSVAS